MVLLAGIAAIVFISGDDDGGNNGAGGGDGVYKAEDLVPDMIDIGLQQTEKQADAAATAAGQDTWRAIYRGSGSGIDSVQVYAAVLKDTKTAESQFVSLASALRNPPKEFVGGDADQVDTTPTSVGENAKAYVTARADAQSQYVWTDIYRFDKAVVIVQTLGRKSDKIDETRLAVAKRIEELTR